MSTGYAIQTLGVVSYDEETDTGTSEYTTEWIGMKPPSGWLTWWYSWLNRYPIRVVEFELPYEQIEDKG